MTPFLLANQWSASLVGWTVDVGLLVIVLGMFMSIYRLLRGPHMADRAVAAGVFGVQLIALVLLQSMRLRSPAFFDGILVLPLLSFAGLVAAAQYIARHGSHPEKPPTPGPEDRA